MEILENSRYRYSSFLFFTIGTGEAMWATPTPASPVLVPAIQLGEYRYPSV